MSYGFPLSLGKQEQVVELCKPPKVKENLQPIFPVHLSACFCPSLKPLQVHQFLAPCLQHKCWSFELSKPRSGLLPITCCTLTSRSPKNPKGIFIVAFLRPFFSSTHRHIQSRVTHANLLSLSAPTSTVPAVFCSIPGSRWRHERQSSA